MASWTDSIPEFNPYVQQLPVEAMVQVGTQKQQQYTEGIKKIQANIDNVAGLDVVRDIDKQYLQSKLNQLGNDTRAFAAADFSDFQLTNAVNGMTNSIVKDPYVQTAVSSSAWYRRQSEEMNKAISEGKASQANIYDFNEKAGAWLESKDLKQGFNGRYTQYTDVKKKAMEAIKALHPKLSQIDIPFEVDGSGRINTNKIADAMIKHKIEGIDEKQVQQAIAASMTPDDLNQLNIDAKYTFRGVSPEQLVGKAKADYDANRDTALNDLAFLRTQKQVTTDPTKLAQIEDRITEYEDLLGSEGTPGKLAEQFYKNVDNARKNPDAVKFDLYKDGFVKEFANAFSWKTETKEYVTNPLRQQQNWVAEMKLKQEVENRNRYEFSVNTGFKQQELNLKKEELNLKAMEVALKNAELNGDPNTPWTSIGNETDNELNSQALFVNHVDSVDGKIESSKQSLRDKGYSDAAINKMITSWKDNQGVASKADVPARAVGMIQEIAKDQNYLQSLERFEKNTMTEAEKEAGVGALIARSTIGKTPLTFSSEGQRITLSPKEIINVKLAETKIKVKDNAGHTVERTYIDTSKLNAKQLKYAEGMYGKGMMATYKDGALTPTGEKGVPTFSVGDRTTISKIVNPHNEVAGEIKSAYAKANTIYKQKLGAYANEFAPQIKAVATGKNGEPPPAVLTKLSTWVTAADSKKIAADDNYDQAKVSAMLTDKKKNDTRVFIKQDGENYEVWLKNESDPGNIQKLKLTAAEVAANFGAGYVNPRTQESARIKIGRGNTNLTGLPEEAIMQKQFGDFPNIKNYKITADLEADASNPDLFIPRINLKLKSGKYMNFEIAGSNKLSRVGFEQGRTSLNNLNDETLEKILKQAYPNFDFSTLDK